MNIRQYELSDEERWLECYMLAYYNSIYYDVLVKTKPRYENPVLEFVAIASGEIVGILDVEIEQVPGLICGDIENRSGLISIIGIKPLYRQKGLATKLVEQAIKSLGNEINVNRLEIWVREDPAILSWLGKLGFQEKNNFYDIILTTDFFEKYAIDLPFEMIPSYLYAQIEKDNFSKLAQEHPPEKTYHMKMFEKRF